MKGLSGMILGSNPEDDRDLSKSEDDNDKTLNYEHSEAIHFIRHCEEPQRATWQSSVNTTYIANHFTYQNV